MAASSLTAKAVSWPWLERGLDWLAGDSVNRAAGGLTRVLLLPILGIGIFLLLWAAGASQVETSLGQLPGPAQVWEQGQGLWSEHRAERDRDGGEALNRDGEADDRR